MTWSRIQDTPLAVEAFLLICANEEHGCAYHNWGHVESMYQYLADTNEPYDEALDWAVLFHDSVYDAEPEKELRSAKMFVEMCANFRGFNLRPAEQGRVHSLIMRTADHVVHPSVLGSSAIIRADLHGLTNKLTTYQNFGKIMEESMVLYGIDEVTFAKNSEDFMSKLLFRVAGNMSADPDHKDFYVEVCEGIAMTIKLAQLIQGKLK